MNFIFHFTDFHRIPQGILKCLCIRFPKYNDSNSHGLKSSGFFQDMTTELKAFAARPEHQTSDSTFLVFMSHGIRDGICGKKYSEQVSDVLEVNTIFQMLNTWNCPSLKDKPKVIIIQACRGGKS